MDKAHLYSLKISQTTTPSDFWRNIAIDTWLSTMTSKVDIFDKLYTMLLFTFWV